MYLVFRRCLMVSNGWVTIESQERPQLGITKYKRYWKFVLFSRDFDIFDIFIAVINMHVHPVFGSVYGVCSHQIGFHWDPSERWCFRFFRLWDSKNKWRKYAWHGSIDGGLAWSENKSRSEWRMRSFANGSIVTFYCNRITYQSGPWNDQLISKSRRSTNPPKHCPTHSPLYRYPMIKNPWHVNHLHLCWIVDMFYVCTFYGKVLHALIYPPTKGTCGWRFHCGIVIS